MLRAVTGVSCGKQKKRAAGYPNCAYVCKGKAQPVKRSTLQPASYKKKEKGPPNTLPKILCVAERFRSGFE
jgi:hypothetical protein